MIDTHIVFFSNGLKREFNYIDLANPHKGNVVSLQKSGNGLSFHINWLVFYDRIGRELVLVIGTSSF